MAVLTYKYIYSLLWQIVSCTPTNQLECVSVVKIQNVISSSFNSGNGFDQNCVAASVNPKLDASTCDLRLDRTSKVVHMYLRN